MNTASETGNTVTNPALFEQARVLIVDDQKPNVLLLERYLQQAGCTQIRSTTDSSQTALLVAEFDPDLILLDLMMPELDGYQVLHQISAMSLPGAYLPILVLTADISPQAKRRALAAGARDFLTKPFDATEAVLRMQNLLETRSLHSQLQLHNRVLEERVLQRTKELEESQLEVLQRLARAAEFRDDDTGQHTNRVGSLTAELARRLSMEDTDVRLLRRASPLHDVGKIGISDAVLLKPGRLTPEEFDVIKTHTTIGARLLSGGQSDLVKTAATIALTHHERWDGTGYPQGLKGEDIPLCGRIVALADVFDALTHSRPYKEAWPVERALSEIEGQSGRQFDPGVVQTFREWIQERGAAELANGIV